MGEISWFYGLPILAQYYNPVIDIHLSGLGWKSKYDSPRHEWNPFIAITLFRSWQIVWMWHYCPKSIKDKADSSCISMATWEAILDIAVYNRTIEQVYKDHQWLSNNHTLTIKENLRSKWKKMVDIWKKE